MDSFPPVLAGRGRQLSQIEYVADQLEAHSGAESIVWSGLRGMGKTVLLHQALDRLRDRGWLAGYSEVRKNAGVCVPIAAILLQGQAGRGKLTKALAWLRDMAHAATISAGIGDFSVQLGLAPAGRCWRPRYLHTDRQVSVNTVRPRSVTIIDAE